MRFHHLRKDLHLKSAVAVRSRLEKLIAIESAAYGINVHEITSLCTAEECKHLPDREVMCRQGWPRNCAGRRSVWRAVNAQIDRQLSTIGAGSTDCQPSKFGTGATTLDCPSAIAQGTRKSFGCKRDVTTTTAREKVEVLGAPVHEPLGDKRSATSQQKAFRFRKSEEDRGDSDLQLGEPVAISSAHERTHRYRSITGSHASRSLRGSTRSSQMSTSSAPST